MGADVSKAPAEPLDKMPVQEFRHLPEEPEKALAISVADLDLSKFPHHLREEAHAVLRKHEVLWSGHLRSRPPSTAWNWSQGRDPCGKHRTEWATRKGSLRQSRSPRCSKMR